MHEALWWMLSCDASFNPHSNYVESWAGLELLAFGYDLTSTLFHVVLQEGGSLRRLLVPGQVWAFKGPGEIRGAG